MSKLISCLYCPRCEEVQDFDIWDDNDINCRECGQTGYIVFDEMEDEEPWDEEQDTQSTAEASAKCEICGANSWCTIMIRGRREYGSRQKIEICLECGDALSTLVAMRNPAVIAEIKKIRQKLETNGAD